MWEFLVVVVDVHFDTVVTDFLVGAVEILQVFHGASLGVEVSVERLEIERDGGRWNKKGEGSRESRWDTGVWLDRHGWLFQYW